MDVGKVVFMLLLGGEIEISINSIIVRPLLSGHVGTDTNPDKRFVRIWELYT